ncbi:hypothetical protein Phum_PHUM103580 [Pediculus humanus corporis]|uniref:Uncharacterized protein n=1 Tax=Pediculus humanus subsp. corporis TaxID=121224 RepID=E0VD14_PEDHC|nr:uncharacterized protein Phum_PHUM103580 [Pediculus humanus corporis]EEB11270.1 hypothetical protein Phum_PHUM103580 [Pediculus humanus corporis]
MSSMSDVFLKFQSILNDLGPPINPECDPNITIALRPQLCFIRDEIYMENKAFITVRFFITKFQKKKKKNGGKNSTLITIFYRFRFDEQL